MAEPAVKIEGLRELLGALRRIDKGLTDAVKEANREGARLVVAVALPNVPVRSGRLKRSVRALGSQRSGRAVAGSGRVSYGAAIHWGRKRGNVGSPPGNRMGTNQIKGRPFLHDAAQRARPQVVASYERAIGNLLDRIMR